MIRKLFALLSVASVVLSLCACAVSNNLPEPTTEEPTVSILEPMSEAWTEPTIIEKETTQTESMLTTTSQPTIHETSTTSPATEASPTSSAQTFDFKTHFLQFGNRNPDYRPGELGYVWITDTSSLRQYILDEHQGKVSPDEYLEACDDAFFETHELIAISMDGSSSVLNHKISVTLTPSSNGEKEYTLQPVIHTIRPDGPIIFCDVLCWNFLVEVPKEYGKVHSELLKPIRD